ncbi:hypothetical protein ACFWBB_13910 [Streptomyces sp. NPDC060000]|uniref:hypothetical protein n=1 Tax=Streptomyces sp. NPDC060000 TaxID=3347031 RepID=UPI00369969B4
MADARRRLRSGTVVLGGMGVLAAALTACSSDDPDKRCVDRDSYNRAKGYKVVADTNCKSGKSPANGVWYDGGKKNGSWVDGGALAKPGKGSGGSSSGTGGSGGSGVSRGGFGGDSDGGSHKGSSGG